ncbi:MAG: hypothetical protein ACKO9Q_31070, partial [Pirellula sp.]
MPIGSRVPTKNPNRFEVDPQPEPDQDTWAKVLVTVERSAPALQNILEKSVRELGAIRLMDPLVRVSMLQLSSLARSIAVGSL